MAQGVHAPAECTHLDHVLLVVEACAQQPFHDVALLHPRPQLLQHM